MKIFPILKHHLSLNPQFVSKAFRPYVPVRHFILKHSPTLQLLLSAI